MDRQEHDTREISPHPPQKKSFQSVAENYCKEQLTLYEVSISKT